MLDFLFIDGLAPVHYNHTISTMTSPIFSISPLLRRKGCSFKILNMATLLAFSLDSLGKTLSQNPSRIVGMSTYADNVRNVIDVTNFIKDRFSDTAVILGGPQVTSSREWIFKYCRCDYVLQGEVERSLPRLLDLILDGKGSPENISGLIYRDGDGIKTNTDRDFCDLKELDSPDFNILDRFDDYWLTPENSPFKNPVNKDEFIKIIKGSATILTGRGCPYSCIFCSEGRENSPCRLRPPELVKKDILECLKATRRRYIPIADDTFTVNRKRVQDMCRVISEIRADDTFFWFAEGRVDVLADQPDLITLMRDNGLKKLQIGVESGNQDVINRYNKRIVLEQVESVVETCGRQKVFMFTNFILGGPGENAGTLQDTLDFALKLIEISDCRIDISSAFLVPFAGTPIRTSPEKYSLKILEDPFELMKRPPFTNEPICLPKGLTLDELKRFKIHFDREVLKKMVSYSQSASRNRLDDEYLLLEEIGSSGVGKGWLNTIYKWPTFSRYYALRNRPTTLKTDGQKKGISPEDSSSLIPVRLWEPSRVDAEHNLMVVIGMNRERLELKDDEIELYFLADGRRTIGEIAGRMSARMGDRFVDGDIMVWIRRFYDLLEEKTALLYQKYR
jgi:anaerobic magnesium-protoporphyrin IX monomethyl ester cyclase